MSIDLSKLNVVRVEPVRKEKPKGNPFRVEIGNIFIQPTKGYTQANAKAPKVYSDDPKKYNWKYCYFGVRIGDQDSGGFSMDNRKFLELCNSGMFSQELYDAFVEFSNANAGLVQVVG